MPLWTDLPAATSAAPTDEVIISQAGIYLRASLTQIIAAVPPAFVMPAGIIVPYAGASLPAGFLNCNGAAVSRTTYSALFAALGVTWGAGDGSTTFNLPDLRGRALIGVGTGSGLTARALAASGGEEAHQLSVLELASHLHKFNQFWDDTSDLTALAGMPFAASQYALQGDVQGLTAFSNSGTTGNDNAHNNMQPWAAAYWIVKT